MQLAKEVGSKFVVVDDGGYIKQVADVCIRVKNVNDHNVTPHTEAFQAIVWHLLVAHPLLLANEMKWESGKMNNFESKIYADGADINEMIKMDNENFVTGFTTNPTLMSRLGITDYLGFAKDVLSKIKNKSISFEVFSDDIDDMYRQALILRDLGENVWVKIPVTNTKSVYTYDLINKLSSEGVKINATALFTKDHIKNVYDSLDKNVNSIISFLLVVLLMQN